MTDDDTRDVDLANAVADITEYTISRLTALREDTGTSTDFHLIVTDGDHYEVSSQVSDHDSMADTFAQQVSRWVTEGHCTFEDDQSEDPLFTATFDPAKARLS
jgi:hypothetical protein